jgi:hypothetical protein
MDNLLIEYCKKNQYSYIDCTELFIEFNYDNSNKLIETLTTIEDNCIIKIRLNNIHDAYGMLIKNTYNITHISNKIMYLTNIKTVFHNDDIIITNVFINYLLCSEIDTCRVCLDIFDNDKIASCPICYASYHIGCIKNNKYPCYTKDGDCLCAICKTVIMR